jgi:hypothetical protein
LGNLQSFRGIEHTALPNMCSPALPGYVTISVIRRYADGPRRVG